MKCSLLEQKKKNSSSVTAVKQL